MESPPRNFRQMLENQWGKSNFVAVNLAPDWGKIPQCIQMLSGIGNARKSFISFCMGIVDKTHDRTCAYILDSASFEAMFAEGLWALAEIVRGIKRLAPGVPIVYNAEFGNGNPGYVRKSFELLDVDAVTVSPWRGKRAMEPFLNCADKGVIVVCGTPDSSIQGVWVQDCGHLSHALALNVADNWNGNENCAVSVEGWRSDAYIRRVIGDMPIFISGTGTQTHEIRQAVENGKNSKRQGLVLSFGDEIIFAGNGENFADESRKVLLQLHKTVSEAM